jgi:hypothetical protein
MAVRDDTRYAVGDGHGTVPRDDGGVDLVRAAPVLAKLAVAAWWRVTGWTVAASISASARVVRGAANGDSPADLIREAEAELREFARRLLGVETNGEGEVVAYDPPPEAEVVDEYVDDRPTSERLRERGAELLRRSADVHYDDDAHPAYARMLGSMAPDEARILRLLHREGPQASVDVRTAGARAIGRSEMVAPGLNMIAAAAGCRRPERVRPYLDNLSRLGLIWFSREPLPDPLSYQVLEAQPEVTDAMKKAGRGKTVRRSIHLTAFGDDFCGMCLPDET